MKRTCTKKTAEGTLYLLVDAVSRRGHKEVVDQHAATLVARDTDVRLPRELPEARLVPAYDSFGKLRYSRDAAA